MVALTLALAGGSALAQDLESERAAKEAELAEVRERGEVLSTEIAGFTDQINQLAGEVAVLRNREAIVAEELALMQARLREERARLAELKDRLGRSLNVLSNRLVEIYKSDQPDALTVILESDGFDDLIKRYDYLDRIQDQDAGIVHRVRDLRDESEDLVAEIEAARDEIAARKAELERTRMQLEAREAELAVVRDDKAVALEQTQEREDHLEGDISELDAQIQAQLQAAQASTTTSDPLPAGPIQGASGGFIWPVNGPVTSPYGPRWGRLHAGIDISAPGRHPDSRGEGRKHRSRPVGSVERWLRQLHVHRPRRGAHELLRAPVFPIHHLGICLAGRRDRPRRLHRQLLRRPPPLRDPCERRGRGPARVPLGAGVTRGRIPEFKVFIPQTLDVCTTDR